MDHNIPMEPRHDVIKHLSQIAATYQGDFRVLESAIGAYFLGQSFGWKTLYMVHGYRTVKRYALILGFNTLEDFRNSMPFEGPHTGRMYVFRIVKTVTDFWKVVTNRESVLTREQSGRKADIVS
jgi:hypothetical protein